MTAPDNRNDAVQFLFKHGDLTFSAAHAAVEKLCNNGFRIVRADLAVPAQVRVKPLVWTGDGHWHSGDNEGWMEEANTPFGWGYAVEFGTLDTGPWKVSSTFGSDIVKFDTPSAAKAAAQADYEARILAAIEPQPAPRDEVIARLVEAGTNYHNAIEGFDGRGGMLVKIETVNKCGDELRAALAAAKAVQHG